MALIMHRKLLFCFLQLVVEQLWYRPVIKIACVLYVTHLMLPIVVFLFHCKITGQANWLWCQTAFPQKLSCPRTCHMKCVLRCTCPSSSISWTSAGTSCFTKMMRMCFRIMHSGCHKFSHGTSWQARRCHGCHSYSYQHFELNFDRF